MVVTGVAGIRGGDQPKREGRLIQTAQISVLSERESAKDDEKESV